MVSTGVPEVVATPEPVEPTVNEDGTVTVQESWWPSADGSHQIHQLTDGTMWNENGQRCDAQQPHCLMRGKSWRILQRASVASTI